MKKHNYILVLEAEYERRRGRNPKYSLRSFARALGVDAAMLSRVLGGKQPPSLAAGQKLAAALALGEADTRAFLESVVEAQKTKALGAPASDARAVQLVDQDDFAVISQLYHYALLELTFAAGFDSNPRAVARRLGITVIEAEQAIQRLCRLELLAEQDGRLVKTDRYIQTADQERTTPALKAQQREILTKARDALERHDLAHRSNTGMTMCIDPAKLPLAKKLINDFMFRLCETLESGDRREVYQLSVSLFSLER